MTDPLSSFNSFNLKNNNVTKVLNRLKIAENGTLRDNLKK